MIGATTIGIVPLAGGVWTSQADESPEVFIIIHVPPGVVNGSISATAFECRSSAIIEEMRTAVKLD
jgi:hypothetical protein